MILSNILVSFRYLLTRSVIKMFIDLVYISGLSNMKFHLARVLPPLLYLCLLPTYASAEVPFSRLWSGYSTSLNGRSEEQRGNALLAGRDLDGVIIPPGATFSFNQRVGARDRGKGYRAAPYLTSDGLLVDTPGGGICQLASTIYNAALLGGVEIVERHPHSRVVPHVPPGRDATISSWRKDLKLKNPFPTPLLLRISAEGGRLTASFRSVAEKDFRVEILSEQVVLEPQSVTGQGVKRQNGGTGFSTSTWRVTEKGGVKSRELLSEDFYPAPSRIIAGGGR